MLHRHLVPSKPLHLTAVAKLLIRVHEGMVEHGQVYLAGANQSLRESGLQIMRLLDAARGCGKQHPGHDIGGCSNRGELCDLGTSSTAVAQLNILTGQNVPPVWLDFGSGRVVSESCRDGG